MKNLLCRLLLLFALSTIRAAESPDADAAKPVASRIADVTVYADRAQIMRKAGIELSAGSQRLAFARLPGWLDEGSVRVALVPASAAEILDVQVLRTFLSKASDEDFRKAEAAVIEISDRIAALDDEKAVLEAESRQIDAIRAFSLDKLPRDVAVREIKPGEFGDSIKFITGSLRDIATAKRQLEIRRRELLPDLTARQRTLDAMRQRSQLEERTVVVTLNAASPKTAELRLTYMLPGATWEPVHELRATPDGKAVTLVSHAVVRQTSGEDWSGVNLWLSTQRSTETMKIPELESLLLGSGRRIARVNASAQSSFSAANTYFLNNNALWFDVQNPDAVQQKDYRGNFEILTASAGRVEKLFDTLRERGTTAHFPALAAQIIRSDGSPVRVPIGSAELGAQNRILAAPELSLNAARVVDLTNSTKQALLPGKVSLFLDGAFLGLTETDFVAPGESFSLYLGVADEIKLSRTLDKKHSELKRSGQRTRISASFLVSAENLSDHSVSVQLAERIPVSETDEIKVSGVKISPEGKPDAKGLLRWDLDLGPKKSREFRVEYTIEYPNDIVQKAAVEGKPAAQQEMFYRIKSLENQF